MINVEGTLLKTHFNLMLISLKCDQVTILDRNTCKTYNVSYLIIQRYFRQYNYHLGFNNSDLKQLARFFFKFVYLCTIFFLPIFFVREFFFDICPTLPSKIQWSVPKQTFSGAKQTLLALIMQKTDVPRRKKNFARKL